MLALSLTLPGLASAQDVAPRGEWDSLYAVYMQRADLAKHKEAARLASELAAKYPADKEAQILCARSAYYCGHRIASDQERKMVCDRGVVCSKRILDQSPNDYDGRYWASMTTFKSKSIDGIKAALKEANKIKGYLEQMIKDDPSRYEAFMMLGTLYRELPPVLTWGNPQKAVEYLEKGYKNDPHNPDLLLELAAAYAKVGRKEEARTTYQKCIDDGKDYKDMEWETQDAKDYAKKMKKELDGK
jgi:tetratricopeptide (TPR) repeat protein